MKRRTILGGIGFLPFLDMKNMWNANGAFLKPALKKPARLKVGDTIALIAPSGPVASETADKALENLTKMGFKPQLGSHVLAKKGYLAGDDDGRAADFNAAFADPKVDAVFCIRGGYGAMRILPKIDFNVIKKNPKIFIGYSDITAFHTTIHQKTGLVTFHGPVGSMEHSDFSRPHFWNMLQTPQQNYLLPNAVENRNDTRDTYHLRTLREGVATGQLIGGNLTLLAAMCGTPYELTNLKGKILFLEDVDERPYRIDAMLTQLMRRHRFDQLAGLALGIWADCVPKGDDFSCSLMECLKDKFSNLNIPIVYGLSFGHIRHQYTIPVGVKAQLDATQQSLTLLETAVL